MMKEVVSVLSGPSIFWLDGHFSFGITAGQERECPLLEELSSLGSISSSDIILVDDANMFSAPAPSPHRSEHWPSLSQVFDALQKINPRFYIAILENAIVAIPAFLRERLAEAIQAAGDSSAYDHQAAVSEEKIFIERGLWDPTEPLRLHLGCGENHLDGYINIDYSKDRHNVMNPKPDYCSDLRSLSIADLTVAEIRLQHVFEHCIRVDALAMLIRWNRWLVIGGRLRIETPDIIGSAKTLLSPASYRTKSGVIRHLVGDQATEWGYHIDQWFPERFERTLTALGFTDVQTRSWNWANSPYLSNVEITATKIECHSLDNLLASADLLLWDSTVDEVEIPTHAIWCKRLRTILGASDGKEFGVPSKMSNLATKGVSSQQ